MFPSLWAKLEHILALQKTYILLSKSSQKQGNLGAILVGASLGPVFTSCSPTYFLILTTVLPQNFLNGIFYLSIYCLGLAAVMLPIAVFGQKIIQKLKFASNPNGKFKKFLGVIFVVLGLMIIFGLDKKFEASLLKLPFYQKISSFESSL